MNPRLCLIAALLYISACTITPLLVLHPASKPQFVPPPVWPNSCVEDWYAKVQLPPCVETWIGDLTAQQKQIAAKPQQSKPHGN